MKNLLSILLITGRSEVKTVLGQVTMSTLVAIVNGKAEILSKVD